MKRAHKITIAVFLSVCLLSLAGGSGAAAIYFWQQYRQSVALGYKGYEAAMRGEFEAAHRHYDAALPKWATRRVRGFQYAGRGHALLNLGKFDEALRDLDRAVQVGLRDPMVYANRGFAYEKKLEYDRALADYSQAIDLDSNCGFAFLNRAGIYERRGELDAALRDSEEAVRCLPGNVDALMRRGSIFLAKKYYESARASFEAAQRIDPRNPAVLDGLHNAMNPPRAFGSSPADQSRPLEQEIQEKEAYALLNEGIAALQEREDEKAIASFNAALAKNPGGINRAAILCNRAFALARTGNRIAAGRDYDEALKSNPFLVEGFYNRAINFGQLRQFEKAIADDTRAIELDPRYARAYAHRALIYLARRQLAKATQDIDRAVELDPKFPEARLTRARLLIAQRKMAESLREFDVALELSPGSTNALNGRAWLLATSRDPAIRNGARAVDDAVKACEGSNWTDAATIDTLAAAYAEAGDFNRAVETQKRAIAAAGNDAGLVKEMKARQDLYRRRKPYRDTQ